ncbi:hypothetical protein WJX79_002745 [Trebouxia sp. C0005]
MSFGSFSFGQSQAAPAFGASSPSLFGAAPSPTFGGQPASSPFGQTSGGMFGAAATPAFGQPSTPAFGTPASTPAFGSTGFGAAPTSFGFGASPAFGQSAPAFGAQSAPAFGAQSSAAFGAQSAPAFGATPAFGGGAGAFGGGGAFGAKPAFGASSPAFGASATSTPAFGQTPGGFGAASQPFGQTGFGQQQPASGTRTVAWRKTAASDSTTNKSDGSYFSITAMPEYANKSFEELRWEDYQAGVKGNTGGFGAASAPAFGQSQAAGGIFGAPQSSPGFGSIFSQPNQGFGTTGFGQSAQQQQQSQQQAQPQQQLAIADPNSNPYGLMPDAPKIPEYATGLAARPGLGTALSRSSPLLAPRPISRALAGSTFGKLPARSRPRSGTPAQAEIPSMDQAAPSTALVFTPRSNPRHLFVRSQLPSTEASSSTTTSPVSVAGGKTSDEQTDDPSSSKQPGQPSGADADGEQRKQETFHSPARDEMLEEDGDGEAQQQVSDAQIQQLLPKLAGTEYIISPSAGQLAMLVRSGGSSELKRVANFTVMHKAWGAVRWLEPVDVRSLPLKDIVQIAHKNVDVYPANGPTKPDMGEGLNKPAEISLYKIVKRDANGTIIRQGQDFQKFVHKLKLMSSRQGTEFVSYDEERGIWKFRVEHFSRYGLLDSDDEDEDGYTEPMQENTAPQQPKDVNGKAAQAAPSKQGYGLFDEDEDMDDDLGSDQTGGVHLDGNAEQDGEVHSQTMASGELMLEDNDLPSPSPEAPCHSPELALALSSGYQHDPQELLNMQQALFAGPEDEAAAAGGKRKSKSADPAPFFKPATFAEGQAPNVWKRPQPALQPPASTLQGEPSVPPFEAAALAISEHSPPSGQTAADTTGPDITALSGCLVDAGLMLGQTCRVCWAPNGTLVIPGRGPAQSAVAFKRLAHLPTPVFDKPDARASSKDQRLQLKQQEDQQRSNLQQALQLHLDNSSPDVPSTAGMLTSASQDHNPNELLEDDSVPSTSGSRQHVDGQGVPRWRLRCQREAELDTLSTKLADLSKSMLDKANRVQKLVLEQQIRAWILLGVLYMAIKDESEITLPDKPSLPEMMRRECLSSWLKQAAADGIKRANHHSRLSGIQHVAQLLSGHQTAAATILAASMGDVRLATLVSQTGVSSSARQLIERQLDTWQSQTWEGEAYANHIDPDCLLIYQLLAGQLQQVIPRLDLDWRRALGLHFWYHQPTTASISDLLDSYSDSVSSDRDGVPQPKPLYQEAAGVQPPRSSTAANAVDFQLLRLAAGDLLGTQPAVGLAELLRPAGVTPDPLDHSFAWQLLSVLQAVDAVALEDDNGCSPTQVFQLHMSLISEIEALGHMSHWAVYVALHMPGHPSQEWSHLRESVVRELLLRHAPEWAPDASKRGFLLHKLHIPPAWLDQSLAQWSRYCRDDSGELQHLMEAGLWGVGLYATFFELRDAFRHARGDESGQQQRMHDYLQFAQQLQHVAPIWRAGSGSTLRQVVLSELSAQVTKWLLKDASPVAQQQPQDIALTGFGTSSSMLNIQLATNWLAQCAG